jgi:hypothetical protein
MSRRPASADFPKRKTPCYHGEEHPQAKLTNAQVREVFDRLATGKASSGLLAKEYGVSEGVIDQIRNGKRWKTVRPPGWKPPRLMTKAGALNSQVRLTEAQVIEIRRRLKAGEGIGTLGKAFGVNHKTIYDIKLRRNWKHLKGDT